MALIKAVPNVEETKETDIKTKLEIATQMEGNTNEDTPDKRSQDRTRQGSIQSGFAAGLQQTASPMAHAKEGLGSPRIRKPPRRLGQGDGGQCRAPETDLGIRQGPQEEGRQEVLRGGATFTNQTIRAEEKLP
eukprot:9691011-Heterocapsa_arctica.AAC.1